jgi:hypothetical protein
MKGAISRIVPDEGGSRTGAALVGPLQGRRPPQPFFPEQRAVSIPPGMLARAEGARSRAAMRSRGTSGPPQETADVFRKRAGQAALSQGPEISREKTRLQSEMAREEVGGRPRISRQATGRRLEVSAPVSSEGQLWGIIGRLRCYVGAAGRLLRDLQAACRDSLCRSRPRYRQAASPALPQLQFRPRLLRRRPAPDLCGDALPAGVDDRTAAAAGAAPARVRCGRSG